MSVVMVVVVALGAFFYIKGTRAARLKWLRKIDLPGQWQAEYETTDEGSPRKQTLSLQGKLDAGHFVLQADNNSWRGQWQLRGHMLHLQGEGRTQKLDLHYFGPGSIGLEDTTGVRRLYTRELNNVVPLRGPDTPNQRREP
ncbi:MAG: hypothetical protein ACFHXK_08010 [bacterium]